MFRDWNKKNKQELDRGTETKTNVNKTEILCGKHEDDLDTKHQVEGKDLI